MEIDTQILVKLQKGAWRMNPRNFNGEYDNYDLFNLPLIGKDIATIDKDSFKKIEYGSIKGVEFS